MGLVTQTIRGRILGSTLTTLVVNVVSIGFAFWVAVTVSKYIETFFGTITEALRVLN